MTENNQDPFAPQESGPKTKFFLLKLIATAVKLTKGGQYTLPDVHDRDGNARVWKGKVPTKGSKSFHLVMHGLADDKDGNRYETYRDMMTFDAQYKDIVYPALLAVFGESAKFPRSAYVPVKIEEAPTGESFTSTQGENAGQEIHKTTWKVVAKFKNEAEMKAAEKEHFARFNNGNGDSVDETPVGPKFDDDTLALIRKQAKAKKSAEQIVKDYIDESIIESLGGESATVELVKEVMA